MTIFSTFLTQSIRTLTTGNAPIKTTATQWSPKKRVSRETMEKIRALAFRVKRMNEKVHVLTPMQQPDVYDSIKLSQEFKLSVEAIRRILKSKYQPTFKDAERQEKNRYKAMGERKDAFKRLGRK